MRVKERPVLIACFVALLIAGAALWAAKYSGFAVHDRSGNSDALAPDEVPSAGRVVSTDEVNAFLAHVSARPEGIDAANGAPEAARPLFPNASDTWPPDVGEARDAYARAAVTQNQKPPFGPPLMPLLSGEDYTIESWERAYYASRPDEYRRFVQLFGDIHELQ